MKILIIRLSSIGDIVLTTPVVRCFKNQEPETEIHYLLKKQYQDVMKNNPYIDKLHFFEDNFTQLLEELKEEEFDFIIDLHKNLRSGRIKRALQLPSDSFNKINIEKYLIVNFKLNFLPDKHIVDRYFEALEMYGIKNDGKGLDYFISKEEEQLALEKTDHVESPYYAFVLGATFFTKKYPADKIIEICEKIKTNVVLLGGSEDQEIGDHIAQACGSHVHNFCGKLSINESAAIIKNASKVLTNDTGLMHIAAAYKKDIITFWGNTIPEFGMYPYKTNHYNAQVEKLKCRPCSKLGYKTKCPKGHFKCMLNIDQQAILDQLISI